MCHQIVLLLPNRPGEFHAITHALAAYDPPINVLGYALSSEGRPGILYLLCSPHKAAFKVLFQNYRYYCSEKQVIVVEVEHKPGQLTSILKIFAEATPPINLPNSYQAYSSSGKALIVMEFDSISEHQRAKDELSQNGVHTLVEPPG